jgi:hypothetical protein
MDVEAVIARARRRAAGQAEPLPYKPNTPNKPGARGQSVGFVGFVGCPKTPAEALTAGTTARPLPPVAPFPPGWVARFTVEQLERLAIRTVDGGLTDREALAAEDNDGRSR